MLVAPTSGRYDLLVQFNSNEASKVSEFVNKLRFMGGVKMKTTSLLTLAAC
jgi:uncharacterized protein with GYD domain